MDSLVRIYRWLNLTSVDVSAGAVICAAFFGKVIDIKISSNVFAGLGLTVWIIYTTDHLLDSKKIKRIASTLRHQFFQRHFHVFTILLIIALLIDSIVVIGLPKPLLLAGVYLIFPIAAYLLLQRYLSPFKELFGAVLYALGVMLPAIVLGKTEFDISHFALAVQFLLVAWMNLLLFSFFDKERDQLDNHVSFTTRFGEGKTRLLIIVIFIVNCGLTLFQAVYQNLFPGIIVQTMSVALLMMLVMHGRFDKDERFRLLGDAVFFLPLLYFL